MKSPIINKNSQKPLLLQKLLKQNIAKKSSKNKSIHLVEEKSFAFKLPLVASNAITDFLEIR
jgi:hypothetical protein